MTSSQFPSGQANSLSESGSSFSIFFFCALTFLQVNVDSGHLPQGGHGGHFVLSGQLNGQAGHTGGTNEDLGAYKSVKILSLISISLSSKNPLNSPL